MIEEWKKIDNYPRYSVSSFGRVRNDKTGRILSPHKNNHGYWAVFLCKDGKPKYMTIHRLVASAFVPNPFSLSTVNHKDQNTENNLCSNLEWCSMKYNLNYKDRNLRLSKSKLIKRLSKPENQCGIYDKIAKLCIEQNRTVKDVASAAGMHSSQLISWNSKYTPRLSTLDRVATILGVDADWFLN